MTLPRIPLSPELSNLIFRHWMVHVWTGEPVCEYYQRRGWDLIIDNMKYSILSEQYLQFLFSYAD